MDIVLWRSRIKEGKEDLAREWMAFLKDHEEEGNETLRQEREHQEVYFLNVEDGAMYAYLFIVADDLAYANNVAGTSGKEIDARHFAYMSACVDPDDCVQLRPEIALGDFSSNSRLSYN